MKWGQFTEHLTKKKEEIEWIKHGRGSAIAEDLAKMHCVIICTWVFMLKSCDSVGI